MTLIVVIGIASLLAAVAVGLLVGATVRNRDRQVPTESRAEKRLIDG